MGAGKLNQPMEACEIAVRLQPRAKANEIVGERGGRVLARVTAPLWMEGPTRRSAA
jgi:uncharacterized protein YggU (UPF0235/DUF167 family)